MQQIKDPFCSDISLTCTHFYSPLLLHSAAKEVFVIRCHIKKELPSRHWTVPVSVQASQQYFFCANLIEAHRQHTASVSESQFRDSQFHMTKNRMKYVVLLTDEGNSERKKERIQTWGLLSSHWILSDQQKLRVTQRFKMSNATNGANGQIQRPLAHLGSTDEVLVMTCQNNTVYIN